MSGTLYLVARIAGRNVGFPASEVDSVIDLGPIVPAPRSAPGVIGIAALRSRVATVIDPRVALGLPISEDRPTRAVVGSVDGHLYAVLVEALEDVADHAARPLPPGVTLDGGWAGVGDALIDRDGEPVLVVSLARLLPTASGLAA